MAEQQLLRRLQYLLCRLRQSCRSKRVSSLSLPAPLDRLLDRGREQQEAEEVLELRRRRLRRGDE